MLILIAESKTMSNPLPVNDSDAFDNHCPLTQDRVEELISSWRELTVDQLAGAIKISPALARSMKLMIHDFPDKSRMSPAIEAYTGVVFKALDFKSLSEEAKQNAVARVRIISSLYGYMRPDDLIKPYRLDFTTVMTPPAIMMSRYWRETVTRLLFNDLSGEGSTEILDLMPADAAACIDFRQPAGITVKKADFKETLDGGRRRTPTANRLKTLRGKLLRHIITNDITDFTSLTSVETDLFCVDTVTDDKIVFHC